MYTLQDEQIVIYKKNWHYLWLVVLLLLGTTLTAQADRPPSRIPGILDLRTTNFDNGYRLLKGQWKFYWEHFQKPNDTGSPSGTPSMPYFEYKKFPDFWTHYTWKGASLPATGYASMQLKILLPKESKNLGLLIPDLNTSYALFLGDSLLVETGKVATSESMSQPYWATKIIPIYGDSLLLTLHIANYQHAKGGGMVEPIRIGRLADLKQASLTNGAQYWFLTGSIVIIGLLFLGLYFFSNQDKPLLYFALFCLLYSYRIIGTSEYLLHDVFPSLPWRIAIHLEYLTLFLSVGMFVLYTRSLFPKDAPQKLMSVLAFICFGYALITILTPPLVFTNLIDSFILLVVLYIGMAFYVYWKAYGNKRIGAQYALLSTVAICMLIIFLIFDYYGIIALSRPILIIGYFAFFTFQSLILPFRFSYILKKAKEEAVLGLKTKNEFMSSMSHEIRTPLNAVIGMAHVMQKENPRDDQRQHLDVLLFSANNLLGIVNDILDLNKIEAGKISFHYEPTDLDQLVGKVMKVIKYSASRTQVNFVQDTLPVRGIPLMADAQKLTQILTNLLSNANKFTTNGEIKCRINIESRTDKVITLKISVSDTGIGIPIEKQKLIFDRFTQVDSTFTRSVEGAGLGLSITKQILKEQQIDIQLSSTPGAGSNFYWYQTFELATAVPTTPTPSSVVSPLKGVSILIVEDIKLNVIVLQKFLIKWGADSVIAQNGQEALDLFDPLSHQLILMDLHMPIMDGYQASRALRKRGVTTPIIALTADIGSIDKIKQSGMNDLILKPYNPTQLLQTILQHIPSEAIKHQESASPDHS
ncbi:signal transduction histidine kinase [Dyadobacter jejuensis]|uniref:histidine kinase n=1 Tax=Dyadobacter jejuensis TaxID=1082580 RepID=A0A316ACP9_9BACT|nr:ATP-binding protein [Dyadobacter jejuensis]PWJ55566.1 signal transduction histidine kinase [Dyadobacter jejuensis]